MSVASAVRVLQGTCGWTDPSLLRCGRFYPSSVKTTEDRLRHFSMHMPCVEVDSSHYAIPAEETVSKWVKATPKGFIFHFKIFQLFSSMSAQFSVLPKQVRESMEPPESPEKRDPTQLTRYSEVPSELRQLIWDRCNAIFQVAHAAGKLGVIVFQFQIGYKPTDENTAYLRTARSKLGADFQMAVEFRDRAWVAPENLDDTVGLLKELKIGLVVADELECELYNSNTVTDKLMPINGYPTVSDYFYVRVHRRMGTERVLPSEQIEAWANRLKIMQPTLTGPIYFMWGTDHEDQPLKNINNLAKAVGTMACDWRKEIANRKGSLGSFFAAKSQSSVTSSSSSGDANGPNSTGESEDCSEAAAQVSGARTPANSYEQTDDDIAIAKAIAASLQDSSSGSTGPPPPAHDDLLDADYAYALQLAKEEEDSAASAASSSSASTTASSAKHPLPDSTQSPSKKAKQSSTSKGSPGTPSISKFFKKLQ